MLSKKKLKEIDITYKGIDLHVYFNIENNCYDHEFGTEKVPDDVLVHSVFVDFTDISEMLVDSQIEEIEQLIKEGLK